MTRAEILQIKGLTNKRERLQSGLFIAEGRKLIEEIMGAGWKIEKIFTTDNDWCGANIEQIAPSQMERISQLKSANNSLALVRLPRHTLDATKLGGKLILALDDVQNPGNVGTIIRMADWFGIEDIVCSPNTADCFNPKVVQATMGSITRVRIHYTDLVEFLDQAAKQKMAIYGTMLDGENIYNAKLKSEGIIVMGNEGKGVSEKVAQRVNSRLLIPPFGAGATKCESLNVAIATSIVCSEFRRR